MVDIEGNIIRLGTKSTPEVSYDTLDVYSYDGSTLTHNQLEILNSKVLEMLTYGMMDLLNNWVCLDIYFE